MSLRFKSLEQLGLRESEIHSKRLGESQAGRNQFLGRQRLTIRNLQSGNGSETATETADESKTDDG